MARVIIAGAKGRMGQALVACAPKWPYNIQIIGQVNRGDNLAAIIDSSDVVIDFSSRDATLEFVELCASHGKAIVIGTTGHSEVEKAEILKFKTQIPIVWTSNFSIGVNHLFWLLHKTAVVFDARYNIEIEETHHCLKKDTPSGTAKTLAEILADVRKLEVGDVVRIRQAQLKTDKPLQPNEIIIHSERKGDVVGVHTVIFSKLGESVELTHRAFSRDAFADGALHAASWAAFKNAEQKPGLYDMQDVLGLK
jgi:4-hydroxy-tetrahydrodipicolinate reductase